MLCIAQNVKSSAKTTTVQVRGKPTEEDVLMLIMENCNVQIPQTNQACILDSTMKARSIGRFLSKY